MNLKKVLAVALLVMLIGYLVKQQRADSHVSDSPT